MKKSVLEVALAFGVSGAFAQDLTSKKGEPILPEAEDWAISLNADPIFTFIGNAFNGTGSDSAHTNGAPGVGWLNGNQTIVAKKFIDEKSAYRVLVRLGFTSQTSKNMVIDEAAVGTTVTFPSQPAQVEDKYSSKNTSIGIGVGKEMRRGKTRLQGYYGADAMIWIAMSGTKATYGNKKFILNCIDYLVDESGLIEVRSKEFRIRPLDRALVKKEKVKWQVINLSLPILFIILFAWMNGVIRKNKYK